MTAHRQPGEPIQTGRLCLMPLTPGDAEEMVDVLGDQGLYEFTGGHPPSLTELRSRYARLAAGHSPDRTQQWRNWIVRRRGDGRAVGTVQATIAADGNAEVAWVIGVAWQRQGIASEAARALVAWLRLQGVRTITAHVHPGHDASELVATRAGLVPTSTFHHGERLWRTPGRPEPATHKERPR
jgi:RimJ/RimL family protein N-acetyltransferase